MRVTTTIERGPVATMPSDQVNVEFSHLIWTNFSGPDRSTMITGVLTKKLRKWLGEEGKHVQQNIKRKLEKFGLGMLEGKIWEYWNKVVDVFLKVISG